MKYAIIIVVASLLGITPLCAQNRRPTTKNALPMIAPMYTLSADPSKFFLSTLDLGVERKMSEHLGLTVRGAMGYRHVTIWEGAQGKYFMYGGKMEGRRYFNHKEGFLRGPYCNVWTEAHNASFYTTIGQKRYKVVSSSGFTTGAGGGWKFNIAPKWQGVTLDIQIGAGYRVGEVSGRYAEKSRSVIFQDKGLVPALAVNLGYTPGIHQTSAHNAPKQKKEVAAEITFHNQKYNKATRKKIEKNLKRNGLNPGRADGKITDKTIQAVKAYQKKNGMNPDGLVGKGTARKLGVDVN